MTDEQTHYKKHGKFSFLNDLKRYLLDVTKGEVLYDDPSSDAICFDSENFINFVVRHLDEALYLRMLWLEIKMF